MTVRLDETTRRALINDLLETSASPGESEILRAVEVTIVVHDDIIPWRYPAKRELQFGEWQRNDILAGIFEPATIDIDLAILLTKAREHSVALVGPAAEELFDPVPEQDLFEALNETLTLWNSPPDWAGDERNVVLTLSRIWYSAKSRRRMSLPTGQWSACRPSISPSYLKLDRLILDKKKIAWPRAQISWKNLSTT